ncbi:MAG: hypothetical protein IKX10_05425 [Lachnospiraceae bacterium]|nr:hypothetical protein [Lachnospiraceae bacterium]
MKKRIAALLMAGMMALSMVGCGGGDKGSTVAATQEDGSVNIRDNRLYFVKIGDQNFGVGAKIEDLEKAGYIMSDKKRDQELPANRYSTDIDMKNADGKTLFQVRTLNTGTAKVKYSEGELGGFTVGSYNSSRIPEETLALNIEFYGGLKLGGTYEDIVKALGEPDFTHKNEKSDLLPEYTTYKYSSGYRGFEFIVDDTGKISQISWNNYDYNEK